MPARYKLKDNLEMDTKKKREKGEEVTECYRKKRQEELYRKVDESETIVLPSAILPQRKLVT